MTRSWDDIRRDKRAPERGTPEYEAATAAFTAQLDDLKARERWHERHTGMWPHAHYPFADCPAIVCRGEVPVPR